MSISQLLKFFSGHLTKFYLPCLQYQLFGVKVRTEIHWFSRQLI